MNQSKWIFHPIFIFILSILALGTSLFLYIYWYVEASAGLSDLAEKLKINPEQILASQTWVVIMVLSILVGIILMGIMFIFIYHQKTYQLYRLQNNFISNFTHELKTPVTSIKLYLETFLKYQLTTDERQKYVQYMLTDISRLSETISSILNIAKLESKAYRMDLVESDLEDIIRRFWECNHHLFQNCKISIDNELKKPILYPIDISLFEMLLMNILTNAVKYNNSPAPTIAIVFRKDDNKLEIHIRDNGIGLDRKELKRIFKKFYQVGKAEVMSARGTGIGLNLVQNIVKMHKGRITAASKGKGRGTTFIVSFPHE
jgi:signal transduction histidine kinase